jgi:putative ABC transport system permease protein
MRTLISDVRHALRLILKSPGVAAVAALSLALGIGANTAIFSVVHAVILKPLPFPRPDAIVSLEERNRDGSPSGQTGWATYADWRTRSRSLSEVAVASYWDPKLSAAAGEAEKLEGLRVSDGFFRVLGIRPALGRDFLPQEDRQGAPRVAILSHGLWQRRFGGDPALVGRTISISEIPFTIVGVLPAGGQDPQVALRDGGGSGRGRSLRSMGLLVSLDAALAFLLLFGAGLLVRSTARLLSVDPGFTAERVLKLEIDVSGNRYRVDGPVVAYFDRVLERARAIPGVTAAGIVSELPLGGNWDSYGVHVEGHEPANPADAPDALRYGATPGYLEAMGIPIRRGRAFTEADREGALPVVLVNETMARSLWPGEAPLGRRIRVGDHPWKTVVGIVGNVRHRGLDADSGNQIYVPFAQWADASGILVLRSAGDPGSLASATLSAVRRVDPDQPVGHLSTLASVVADSAGTRRFAMNLLAGFGILATLLAAVGIYGVVSGYVARRTREIGVRMALGADRRSILGLIGGKAIRLTAIGLAAGLFGAWALGRALRTLLFEVGPTDARALAAGALVVLAVSFGASLVPTRRATHIDPLVCLREE